jgi:hypothetical protein
MLFEGAIVYCIDPDSLLFGRRLKVVSILEDGNCVLIDLRTEETTQLDRGQVGFTQPPALPYLEY